MKGFILVLRLQLIFYRAGPSDPTGRGYVALALGFCLQKLQLVVHRGIVPLVYSSITLRVRLYGDYCDGDDHSIRFLSFFFVPGPGGLVIFNSHFCRGHQRGG